MAGLGQPDMLEGGPMQAELYVREYFVRDIGELEATALRREALLLLNSNVTAWQNTFEDVEVALADFPDPTTASDPHCQSVIIKELGKQIVLRTADERLRESLAQAIHAQLSVQVLSLNHLARFRQAKREWEQTADLLLEEIYLLDSDLRIRRLNVAAAQRLGSGPKAQIGREFPAALAGGDETLRHALPLTTGVCSDFVVPMTGAYYQLRIYRVQWTAETFGYTVLRTDVTRDVHTQQSQLRSARLAGLGQMAMGLAHEINNPLMVILTSINALHRRQAGNADIDRYAAIIVNEVQRCRRITQALLAFGRTPEREGSVVSVAPLLRTLPSRLAASHPEATIELHLRGDARVFGNEDDLLRIFYNLAANAADAAPGSSIEVTMCVAEREVRVEVANPGSEIDPSIVRKMYEPFFTTKPLGTGLGLAFAMKIAENLQGRLWYAHREGKNVFHLALPRVDP